MREKPRVMTGYKGQRSTHERLILNPPSASEAVVSRPTPTPDSGDIMAERGVVTCTLCMMRCSRIPTRRGSVLLLLLLLLRSGRSPITAELRTFLCSMAIIEARRGESETEKERVRRSYACTCRIRKLESWKVLFHFSHTAPY